jgi:ABC-type bacteriocin/lantibiotic exporter with double-glycine peptidase domain
MSFGGWLGRARGAAFGLSIAAALTGAGCATYQGSAAGAGQWLPRKEPGWIWVSGVPEVRQPGEKDCGPAALSAVLTYWRHPVRSEEIRTSLGLASDVRVQAGELSTYARRLGFDAYVFKGDIDDLVSELKNGRPVIVGVAKRYGQKALSHYEVVVGIQPDSQTLFTLDPADGWIKNTVSGFMTEWEPTGHVMIVVFPAQDPAQAKRTPTND